MIVLFDSPDAPPNWIEWIDVENGEYRFCDDKGGGESRLSDVFRFRCKTLLPTAPRSSRRSGRPRWAKGKPPEVTLDVDGAKAYKKISTGPIFSKGGSRLG